MVTRVRVAAVRVMMAGREGVMEVKGVGRVEEPALGLGLGRPARSWFCGRTIFATKQAILP